MRKNALLRFYYRENPEKWNDVKFAKRWAELNWVLKYNGTLVEKNGQEASL